MTAMFQLDYVPNGMFNLFLGQLREHSDLAFSGREYDMQRAMTEAYTIDDEVPPDDAPYPSDD